MSETPERTHGWYSWFEFAAIYGVAQTIVRSHTSRRRFLETHAEPAAGQRWLDVGCGTASVRAHLPNVEYVGVDVRPAYLRTARRRFPNGEFYCGDVAEFADRGSARFDRVIALGVLHHVDDLMAERILRSASLLLKPGGRWISHDPTRVPEQSRWSRWMVDHDRGRFVRQPDALLALASPFFTRCQVVIDNAPLRIPYTEAILVAER